MLRPGGHWLRTKRNGLPSADFPPNPAGTGCPPGFSVKVRGHTRLLSGTGARGWRAIIFRCLSSAPAISADSVGSAAIHMQLLTIPPGVRAKAHKHAAHETAIYVISGEAHMDYGERLEQHLVVRAGDFLYIPADVPHRPYNASYLQYAFDGS